MAQDGCLEVAWKGQAFSYLLHKPAAPDSYAAHRQGADSAPSNADVALKKRAATGTWDGPAPRGALNNAAGTAGSAAAAAAAQPEAVEESQSILLSSGHSMPLVGLGTYKMTSEETIRAALEAGYRHFDCASMYGNEEVIGRGLRDFIAEGRRGELFITSKLWNDAHRPEALRASCLKSIEDLGCSYLDLFLVHWPEAWLPGSQPRGTIIEDQDVTLAQTWAAMEQLVDEGLVRSIGVSNFSLKEVEEVLEWCRIRPAVNQIEMHPLLAQRKLLGVCFRKGVQCVAFSPLGHYSPELMDHPVVQQVAEAAGKTPAQVLLRWNVQRGVPVLPRALSPEHMDQNLEVFGWTLSNEEKALLDSIDCGRRFVDFPWKKWGNPEEGGATKPSAVL